jgi:hypothetical protein
VLMALVVRVVLAAQVVQVQRVALRQATST